MIVKINNENSSAYKAWFSEITDAFKNSGNPDVENIVIDTLEAYYAHIEEIARLSGKYLRMPVNNDDTNNTDEDFLLINNNTREISVKETSFAKNGIAVEADHLAEIVYFKVDRYFDRMDLAQNKMNIEIRWSLLNSKRQTVKYGSSKALFIDAESYPGEVVFGWAVSRDMCSEAGSLSFSVCFYMSTNEDGTENTGLRDYSLNTQIASLPVKAGIGIPDVKAQDDNENNIFKSLFDSVYTDKSITPLDQPTFSYLSWEHDDIPNEYLYPFESNLVQAQIANLGTGEGDEYVWDAPVELYVNAYCPGATSTSYSCVYREEMGELKTDTVEDKDTSEDDDKAVELETEFKYVPMSEEIAPKDLAIHPKYGDTSAVYVKRLSKDTETGKMTWDSKPMSLTEVGEYFDQINGLTPDSEAFEYDTVAKRYAMVKADKVGAYRFIANSSKTVKVDDKDITVNSRPGYSSRVIIPPACKPIAKEGSGLTIEVNENDLIDPNEIKIIDATNQDFVYMRTNSEINKVRTDGLGILVGTQRIGTDDPESSILAPAYKPSDDYRVFAGEFALVINDGKTDEELEAEYKENPKSLLSLFWKIKNNLATEEDFKNENLTFESVAFKKENDKEFSGEYGIVFGEGKGIPVDGEVKIEGYVIHRKNGTYKVSDPLKSDKIATPAAFMLHQDVDGVSSIAIQFALEEGENTGVYGDFKDVKNTGKEDDKVPGCIIYSTTPAERNQGIKLKATYTGDTNKDGFKLRWFYGGDALGAKGMSKEYTNDNNGITVEQNGNESILTINGAVDTGLATYLMLYGENEFNNTKTDCLFDKATIVIGEAGV